MVGPLHAIVFSVVLTYAMSTRIHQPVQVLEKLHLGSRSCPCSSPSYCNRITAADRKEIVGFGVRLDYYKQFDWNKLTTMIVTPDCLEKHGTDFVCYAHQHNVRVLIATSISKDELINATARMAVVQKYLKIAQGYYLDGANVDVEMLTYEPDLRQGLTDYVKETSAAHKRVNPHSLVVTDVPWLPDIYQGHNTWALAKYSDFLFIMSYDEEAITPPCLAGANAPLERTRIGAKLFLDIGIPADKLVVALPWYGYKHTCACLSDDRWCVSTRKGFQCIRMAIDYGTVSQMLSQSMGVQQWSEWYESPFMNYKTENGTGQIWYDDAKSLKLKYNIAEEYDFRGVGMFCVDYLNYANTSDPTTKEMWAALPQYNKTMPNVF